jgi:hypothetical protein
MSLQLINQYYSELDRVLKFAGSKNGTTVRNAFYNLLNEYGYKKYLLAEVPILPAAVAAYRRSWAIAPQAARSPGCINVNL